MTKVRRDWFCVGCGKLHHKHHRDIEGENHRGYWCAASIVRGISERRNDLPLFDKELERRGALRSALLLAKGEQS